MNGVIRCFDIVSMVIDEATNCHSSEWELDRNKLDGLRGYCEEIDELSEVYNCESTSVDVDDLDGRITIELELPDTLPKDGRRDFKNLVDGTSSFKVKHYASGNAMNVTFEFPGVWIKG